MRMPCEVEGVKMRVISNIPGPMGIAVREEGTFMSSNKEHLNDEMLQDTNTLSRSCRVGDCESKWNMLSV